MEIQRSPHSRRLHRALGIVRNNINKKFHQKCYEQEHVFGCSSEGGSRWLLLPQQKFSNNLLLRFLSALLKINFMGIPLHNNMMSHFHCLNFCCFFFLQTDLITISRVGSLTNRNQFMFCSSPCRCKMFKIAVMFPQCSLWNYFARCAMSMTIQWEWCKL